jgi:hypothetical protein
MLPKLDVPIFELKLVSTGKTIRFRPFLVKEQKLLLMATQSEDEKDMVRVIRQIVKNCVIDELNVDTLPAFDLEYLFLNLRARSVNEVVELRYRCNNTIKDENGEDKTCNNLEKFDVNILEVTPVVLPEHSKKIMFNDKLGIVMKYPTFEMLYDMVDKSEEEIMFEILPDCVDNIFDEDSVYYAKDTPREELLEFLDGLQQKDMEKIQKFFRTIPRLRKEVDFHCRKCGYDEKINVEGLQSFFV